MIKIIVVRLLLSFFYQYIYIGLVTSLKNFEYLSKENNFYLNSIILFLSFCRKKKKEKEIV